MSTSAAPRLQADYEDAEIRQLRKERQVLVMEARTKTYDDEVLSSAVIHRPDGTVFCVQTTRLGKVWVAPLVLDGSAPTVEWKEAALAVPDTPAREHMEEVYRIDRRIKNRVETRGGRAGDLEVDEEIAELLEGAP